MLKNEVREEFVYQEFMRLELEGIMEIIENQQKQIDELTRQLRELSVICKKGMEF